MARWGEAADYVLYARLSPRAATWSSQILRSFKEFLFETTSKAFGYLPNDGTEGLADDHRIRVGGALPDLDFHHQV